MTIETATFAVQRGATTYGMRGDQIKTKLQSGDKLAVSRGGVVKYFTYNGSNFGSINDSDLLACTDGGTTYKVTGKQFKDVADPITLYTVQLLHEEMGYSEISLVPDANSNALPLGATGSCQQLQPRVMSVTPIRNIVRRSGITVLLSDGGNSYNFDVGGKIRIDL